MIADDRGSRIADRKKFCDLRSKRIPKYFEFRPMIQRFLATKPEYSLVAIVYLL